MRITQPTKPTLADLAVYVPALAMLALSVHVLAALANPHLAALARLGLLAGVIVLGVEAGVQGSRWGQRHAAAVAGVIALTAGFLASASVVGALVGR